MTRANLEFTLAGRQEAARVALACLPKLHEVFSQYEGKKVYTKTGNLVSKLEDTMQDIRAIAKEVNSTSRVYMYASHTQCILKVIVNCHTKSGFTEYFETHIFFMELEDDVQHLREVREYEQLKDTHKNILNLDAEGIIAKLKELQNLRDKSNELMNSLPHWAYERAANNYLVDYWLG